MSHATGKMICEGQLLLFSLAGCGRDGASLLQHVIFVWVLWKSRKVQSTKPTWG